MSDRSVESDLNFGLIAAGLGLIGSDALVAAIAGWAAERSRPLAAILVERGALQPGEVELLDALLARAAGRPAAGPCPGRDLASMVAGPVATSLAALSSADPVVVAALVSIASAPLDGSRVDPFATATMPASDGIPGPGGVSPGRPAGAPRFRILRPHARGGLGEVFVARDEELDREVALKEIRAKYADHPDGRRRFRFEAEVTGKLEHPGVVPVYGLGHYEDGRPFYAMRLIRGDSLKEAIARFHDDHAADPARRALGLRHLLGRFVDICDAMAYAHSRGVLHRDLKPDNVMLGQYGETLVVDWGLAKTLEPGGGHDPDPVGSGGYLTTSSGSGLTPTQDGAAIGTPHYMSPEQAAGRLDALGPASDVYSLGATLYHALTGAPPLADLRDVAEVLRLVRRGEFPRPRELCPRMPRALEAICLKAMANRPADRYAGPRELATDVEAWLAGEPVMAWREPFWSRAQRWARRHRTAVATAAAAGLVAIAGLSIVLLVQADANRRLVGLNAALAGANRRERAAKEQVQARFALARDAIKSYYTGASEDVLLREPELSRLRARLLGQSADFYRRLADAIEQEPAPDAEALAELSGALFDLGSIIDQIGRRDDAIATLRRAEAIQRRLVADAPADPVARRGLANLLGTIATAVLDRRGAADARPIYHEARAIWARLVADDPASTADRDGLATLEMNLGVLEQRDDNIPEALALLGRACATWEEVIVQSPGDWRMRDGMAIAYDNLAITEMYCGKLDDAGRHLARGLALREALAADRPDDLGAQVRLSRSYLAVGEGLRLGRRDETALVPLRKSTAVAGRAVAASPTSLIARRILAESHNITGRLLAEIGRSAEAVDEYRPAADLYASMVAADPDSAVLRNDQDKYLTMYGLALESLGRRADALAVFERAVESRRISRGLDPEAFHTKWFYDSYRHLTRLRIDSGFAAEAAALARERRDLWPDRPGELADVARDLARSAALTPDPVARDALEAEAVVTLSRSIALGYSDLDYLRRDEAFDPIRGRPDFALVLLDLAYPTDPPFARATAD